MSVLHTLCLPERCYQRRSWFSWYCCLPHYVRIEPSAFLLELRLFQSVPTLGSIGWPRQAFLLLVLGESLLPRPELLAFLG
jgi:hypothetical protein